MIIFSFNDYINFHLMIILLNLKVIRYQTQNKIKALEAKKAKAQAAQIEGQKKARVSKWGSKTGGSSDWWPLLTSWWPLEKLTAMSSTFQKKNFRKKSLDFNDENLEWSNIECRRSKMNNDRWSMLSAKMISENRLGPWPKSLISMLEK